MTTDSKSNDDLANQLAQTLAAAIQNRLLSLHTWLPGVVEVFDENTQRARIKISIDTVLKLNEDSPESTIPKPLLVDVPIGKFAAGGFVMTFPVAVGDEVKVEFCERSITQWLTNSAVTKPLETRFHDLSDGVFYPIHATENKQITNYSMNSMTLRTVDNSSRIELQQDKVKITTDDLEVTGDILLTGNVDVTGDLKATGTIEATTKLKSTSVEAAGKELAGHVHPINSGSSAPGPTGGNL